MKRKESKWINCKSLSLDEICLKLKPGTVIKVDKYIDIILHVGKKKRLLNAKTRFVRVKFINDPDAVLIITDNYKGKFEILC